MSAAEEKARPHRQQRDEAVRAAFAAGVKPPTIALATDIHLSNVRKILRETPAAASSAERA